MKKVSVSKKLISVILSVLLIIGIGSVGVFADDYSFTYCFANDSMTQVYVQGFSGDVPDDGYIIIPDKINGYAVVGITANAFSDVSGISGVVVPYTATYIDNNAFSGNIAVLTPDEYQEYKNSFDIEDWYENSVQDYIISGTTLIGYKGNDSIITIPDGCTSVGDNVFKNKKDITTVYIHSNVESIGASAFENCKNLETVIFDRGMGSVKIGANAFKKTPWLENYDNSFVILGTTLIKYKGDETDVAIPNVLTAVADGAFYDTNAETVKIPVTINLFGGNKCFSLSSDANDVPGIYVYKDSAAQEYCKTNNIKSYLATLPGDVDSSGDISTSDARIVLRAASALEDEYLINEIKDIADVSGDNKVTPADARLVLRLAVGLSAYSVEDVLTMPRSSYEVLLAASNAVSYANAYNCGYSKFEYQQISATDMNTRTAKNLKMFEDELTSAEDAVSVSYKKGSSDALKNFFEISLVNSDSIESYTSVIDDDYYVFTITLKDELAEVDADTYTQKMFPVDSASHFADKLSKKSWSDKFSWSLTYSGCTLEIKVGIDSGRIEYAYLTMHYDFEMSGKTGNTAITNADGTSSVATATRTDIIRYTNFSYYE